MHCEKCEAELRDGAKFCNKCGQVIKKTDLNGKKAPVYQVSPMSMMSTQRKNGGNKAIIVGVIAVVVIIVAILFNGFGLGGAMDLSPKDPAKISIDQMKSDVMNVRASSSTFYNLYFYKVDSFGEFAVAKTEVSQG